MALKKANSVLKELIYYLVLPLVSRSAQIPGLRSTVKEAMKLVGIELVNQQVQEHRPGATGHCNLCPRRDRKSKTATYVARTYVYNKLLSALNVDSDAADC